eukprot:s3661_g6.t1
MLPHTLCSSPAWAVRAPPNMSSRHVQHLADPVNPPNKRLKAKSEHRDQDSAESKVLVRPANPLPTVCGRGLTWHGCWGCSSPEIGIYVLAIQVGRIHLDSIGGDLS